MDRRRFLAAAAFAVAAPAAWARGLGGTPIALVTADLEEHVAAVDLSSGRVVRRIAVAPGPQSIESLLGRTALVGHADEGVVTLIDGPSLRVTHVLRGFGEPRYAAASPGGRYAYLTDAARGELVTVDVARGRVVARIELGGPARHVAASPDGFAVWAALGTKAERVAVVDRGRVRTFAPPFLAHDVAFTPRGGSVWVTSGDRGAIAVYDARTLRLRRRLFAHAPPQHVTFLGELAFVASGDSGTLRVHRVRDGALVRTVRLPRGSFNVQHGWGTVFSPSLAHGTLAVVDARGRPLRRIRVARSSHDACFVAAR
ncbi:MAG TPA: hypothetical protein VM290_02725 [Gaiellaceae bacterium]|nr:hypothetical protein [Gaiellaceae bacterium]